jgi:hypothetical protein
MLVAFEVLRQAQRLNLMSRGLQNLRLAETQPPFHSIHDSRVQDLLASEVVAFAHVDIGWHSAGMPNEAEND